MPTTAVIAATLQGTFTPSHGLFVNGLNVGIEPGTGGNRYGTLLSEIEVTEAGFGGVSSMRFVTDDPDRELAFSEGDEVVYTNLSSQVPEFRGYVQAVRVVQLGLGRIHEVTCVGVEALLDWIVVPSLTIPAGAYTGLPPSFAELVQRIYAASAGIGVSLNVTADPVSAFGRQATPVGGSIRGVTVNTDVVISGQTLRESLRMLSDAISPLWFIFTVDFWLGLRVVLLEPSFPDSVPVDYANLTVTDTVAGPIRAAGLEHETDGGSRVRSVYVKGGNAAGTGMVTDGTGKVGPSAILDDPSILTAAARDAAGVSYLRDKSASIRGSFRRETFVDTNTAGSHIQAMSNAIITDNEVGLAGPTYRIGEIKKRYHGGNQETWEIGYGGMEPSFVKAVRRLTRGTKS